MKLFINDANILIDLVKLDLLALFFRLPNVRFLTSDFVYAEINPEQRKQLEPYITSEKLEILDSDPEDVMAIQRIFIRVTGLSVQDCSIWHYTLIYQGIVLTGDKRLRNQLTEEKIEVRGILYLFDLFLIEGLLSFKSAVKKLTELSKQNKRLPRAEIEKRFDSWNSGNHCAE